MVAEGAPPPARSGGPLDIRYHAVLQCISTLGVQAWLARTGDAQGYIMDLATLWPLASG
jgi:hypothetical protein